MVIEGLIDRLAKSYAEFFVIVRPETTGEFTAASIVGNEVRYYLGSSQSNGSIRKEEVIFSGKEAIDIVGEFKKGISQVLAGPDGHMVSEAIRVIYYKGKNVDIVRVNTYGIDFVFDLPYEKLMKIDKSGKIRQILS